MLAAGFRVLNTHNEVANPPIMRPGYHFCIESGYLYSAGRTDSRGATYVYEVKSVVRAFYR
ncbi:hypothetical protein MNBD_ACTINO01-844 [hydrothermal vent metagenome]|uniref:Uncharacterized protein n=1 Tax=hydrothermal vent metagenome TaxID=652676 RepID=A0A3B0SQY6_9ZZZZ